MVPCQRGHVSDLTLQPDLRGFFDVHARGSHYTETHPSGVIMQMAKGSCCDVFIVLATAMGLAIC